MDYGTLHQLRNLINRRNVVKNPKDNFNACDDYFRLVFQCHVITAALKVLDVETPASAPPEDLKPNNIASRSATERKEILQMFCHAIVDAFTNLHLNSNTSTSHTILSYDDKVLGYAIELLT